MNKSCRVSEGSQLINSDELDVINHLDAYVPEDDTVIINPWDGGAMDYTLAARPVTSYRIFEKQASEAEFIDRHLNQALTNPVGLPRKSWTGN